MSTVHGELEHNADIAFLRRCHCDLSAEHSRNNRSRGDDSPAETLCCHWHLLRHLHFRSSAGLSDEADAYAQATAGLCQINMRSPTNVRQPYSSSVMIASRARAAKTSGVLSWALEVT